ncbi:MAG: ABC transporter permease [Gemmatimonadetes bacterium]|nr:ABC transporter permease [Gemmatimonadota bacterium]MCC7133141.1 ABC transporter permease [Gemmatimonadales bacterium]
MTATPVAVTESTPPRWRRDLVDGVRDTWRARDLIVQLAKRDIRIRYKEAVMGFLWALVMPVMVILSGLIIRTALSRATGGSIDRAVVLGLGLKGIMWGFFSAALGTGTTTLTSGGNLVSKIYFPRAALPIATTITAALDATIALTALTLAAPWLGVRWSAALLWVPILAGLLLMMTAAAVLFFSCANVFFRDVKYLVQMGLTFGIFVTPVFFEPAMLGGNAPYLMLNPLAPILEGLVLAVRDGHNLLTPLIASGADGLTAIWSPWYLGYSAAWAGGGLFLAAAIFRRAEFHLADFV